MLRDIGLWHGPVAGGWLRWLVVVGAGIQVVAALAAAVLIAFTTRWPTAPEPFHAGTPLVAVAAVLAVGIVGGLRLAWGTRSLAAARFSWPAGRSGVRTTPSREPAHSARPGHR
ncbi:hypothetical protein AADG42_03600 [Ammonicoccus fulvus]|uniref:Uncharacterized protein n=1 Tax=Ammonicoccus fulvus TaxID=3138240 RepID=A0ABZ3FNP3_9ACTN